MPPKQKKAKATAGKTSESDSSSDNESPKRKPAKTGKNASPSDLDSDSDSLSFDSAAKSSNGKKWNLKISSWNINGLRAWLQKDGLDYLKKEKPDILCLQETKCSEKKIPKALKEIEGYYTYWSSADQEGYSGVGLITKEEPEDVKFGIGKGKHDKEGRVITAEYDKFYLVNAYVPNAGRKLVRLDYRMEWDEDFRKYLKKLDDDKPVILCGDLNVAHKEIDIKNAKSNVKNAGFTKEERDNFSTLLDAGFIDSFRELYPEKTGAYTFWTYLFNARAKNVGWRLDYFVLSKRLNKKLCDSLIRKKILGSDHCPVALLIAF